MKMVFGIIMIFILVIRYDDDGGGDVNDSDNGNDVFW